jgi:hypothetical protein
MSCGQRDLVVDGRVDLERKEKQDHVWGVPKDDREVLVQTRVQRKAGLTVTRRFQWRRGVVRFGQPGGRGRGERVQAGEKIGAAFIGMEKGRIWQEIDRIERRRKLLRAVISGVFFGWRLKMVTWTDQ